MGNSASKQSTKFVAKSRKLGAKVVSDQNHRILANQTEFIPNSAKQPLSVDNDNNTTSRNGPIESSQSSQINSSNNDNSSPPGKDGFDVQYLQRVQQLGNVISDSFISDKPAKGSSTSSEPASQKNQQLLDMIIKHLDSLPSQNQKTMKNKPVAANNNEMLNALKNRKVQTEAATADSEQEEGKSNTNTQENEQQEKRINNKNSARRYIHPQTLTAIITSRETDSIEKILTDYNLDPLVFKNVLEKSTRLQLIPKEQSPKQQAVHYSEAARQQSFLKESDLDSLANDSEHEMIKNTIIKSGKGDIIGRFNQSSSSSSSSSPTSPSSIKQQEEDAKNPENYSIATRRLLKRLEQMKYYNKAPVEASPNHKNQDQQQLLDYNKINQYIQQSGNDNNNNKKKKQSTTSKPTTKVPKQLSLDD